MLTNRQRKIAMTMLDITEPLALKDLAEQFSVSLSTIKADVKEVKLWFQKNNVEILSKPNKGIWVANITEKSKIKVHHQLLVEFVDEEVWGEEVRVRRIILLLSLHPTKYITAEFIANQLLVSKQTVYKDMKEVESFLNGNDLSLSIIARKGYAISGKEIDIRQQVEYLLTNNIVMEDSYWENIHFKIKQEFSSLSNEIQNIVESVHEKLIHQCESSLNYEPSTLEKFTLFVRLVISISRVMKDEQIQLYSPNKIDQCLSRFAAFAYIVTSDVFQSNSYRLTNEEFNYIYRNALNTHQDNAIDTTNEIISYVSEKLSIPFYEDSTLQSNLLSHLSNKFTNENAILFENNPFMEDLKTKYDYIYQPVKEACEKYIYFHSLSAELSSSFITLHFLVSLETTFSNHQPLKALYVCASGRGVARVVKNRVEQEVPEVKVVHYCGLDDLELALKSQSFDLVISVFPIESELPTIWVEPVPSPKNIEELKAKVKELFGDKHDQSPACDRMIDKIDNDPERLSREVILKGMELYLDLKRIFQGRIKHNMDDAFLMHVLLMVHRVQFSMEYDHLINTNFSVTEDYKRVDELFKTQGLNASLDEKKAILFYVEKEDK